MFQAAQALRQILGLLANIVIAIAGGLLGGAAIKYFGMSHQGLTKEDLFEDSVFWEEVEPEEAPGILTGE